MWCAQLVSFLNLGLRRVIDIELLQSAVVVCSDFDSQFHFLYVFDRDLPIVDVRDNHVKPWLFRLARETQVFFILPPESHKVNQKDSILDPDFDHVEAFRQCEAPLLLPDHWR